MNEAEPSNNEAFVESLNSANSPQVEQASCPFYSVVPSENVVIRQLPLLQPAKDEQPEIQVPDVPEDATKPDWVAEPDLDKQVLIDSEFQKLLTLNSELRAANDGLYEQIEKLQKDLSESDKVIQWQKRRASVTESMLNQQTQELTAAQEQIKSLFQELETAAQNVQRQELCIETYKAQLQISQQRLAQLERECSLLQSNYSEQSQQLLQSENSCRELRTRLMRQQRQTLQFKAALEKCLENPVPGDDSLDDAATPKREKNTKQSRFAKKARSLFPNAQPIKPWSAESDALTDNLDSSWKESASTPSTPSSPWDWSDKKEQLKSATSDNALNSSPIIEDATATPEAVSNLGTPNIDEQIDHLMQMFFNAKPTASSATQKMDKDLDSNQADVSIWDTSATTITDDEPAETLPDSNTPISWVVNNASASANNLPVSPTAAMSEDKPLHVYAQTTEPADNEDYWSDIAQVNQVNLSLSDIAAEVSGNSTIDDKSPSPVVYPKRPPKGRKSLASVELPNFRQQKSQ